LKPPRGFYPALLTILIILGSMNMILTEAQTKVPALFFGIRVEPMTVYIRPPICWATFTVYIDNFAGVGQEPVFVRLMPAPIVTGGISPFASDVFFDGKKWTEFPGKKAGGQVTVMITGMPYAVGTYQFQIFACDEKGNFTKLEPEHCIVAVVDVVFQGGPRMTCERITTTPPPPPPPPTPPPYDRGDWWNWWNWWRWRWPWEWWGGWGVVREPFDFTLSATPTSQSIKAGQSNTFTVTTRLISGAAQPISLSLTGLPGGTTHSFSLTSGNPTFTSAMKVVTDASASPGTYTLTVTGAGGGKTRSATVTLSIGTAKTTSSLSVSVNPTSLKAEEPVSLNGALSPALSGKIELVYQRPDGFEMTKTVTASATGSFSDTVRPEMPGLWAVRARWSGDAERFGCESQPASFSVQAIPETPWFLLIAILAIAAIIIAVVVLSRRVKRAKGVVQPRPQANYCVKCGTEILEGWTFCRKCGEKV